MPKHSSRNETTHASGPPTEPKAGADIETLIGRWFRLYVWFCEPIRNPKSMLLGKLAKHCQTMVTWLTLRRIGFSDSPKVKRDLLRVKREIEYRKAQFAKLSDRLAEAAEQRGINSTAYFTLVEHLGYERASTGDWDAAWALTKRLQARIRADEPAGDGSRSEEDDSTAWVLATKLWRERIPTRKELGNFRKQHPEMFRNPSRYKLEIHAGLWARYWSERDKASFDALDGELPSVADDPDVQEAALTEAARRMASLREEKRRKKQ